MAWTLPDSSRKTELRCAHPRALNTHKSVGVLTDRVQYGDIFTFILLGRRITVALGPKGNNFVLGGKSVVFNAEDAYAVSLPSSHCSQKAQRI